MTLAEKLTEMRNASATKYPAEMVGTMRRATQELRDSGILETAAKAGDKMPDFTLPNMDGAMISSTDLLKKGNLVVTFYRGVW